MRLKYGLDERPPAKEMALFGLQWFAVTIPVIVTIGKITAGFHFAAPEAEVAYLQRLSFVMAVALFTQVVAGHRLPLIIGPSTVLLIGIISSREYGLGPVYTSIAIGGLLLALLSITGLFARLKSLFTTRVVAVVLLLIAFTLTPTVLNLISSPRVGSGPSVNLLFSAGLITAMFLFYRYSSGIWKSTFIIWTMAGGSLFYFMLFPGTFTSTQVVRSAPLVSWALHDIPVGFTVDPGVLVSFIFCFLALAVNDMGSIQSLNELLKASEQPRRLTRGVLVTGLANVFAGLLGVIGPVNFSLSPGVIASTGCGSRLTLLPAALLLGLVAFSPAAIALLGNVPSVVIGCVLLFTLCSQIAAGLSILFEAEEEFRFEGGLVLGLPILLGTVVAFFSLDVIHTFPAVLRPIVGNGFVVGVAAALILEHGVFRRSQVRDKDIQA